MADEPQVDSPFTAETIDRDAVVLALYAGLHHEEALARVAARAVAATWHRPIAVIGAGLHAMGASPFSGEPLFALFDLTEDQTGEIRRRAIVVEEPADG